MRLKQAQATRSGVVKQSWEKGKKDLFKKRCGSCNEGGL